jgi:acetyl-CoA C-acetyltransferase
VSGESADRTAVVVAARRTAFGRVGGLHAGLGAAELLAPLLTELAAALPGAPDDVLIGNAVGGGGNLARLASLRAGLPVQVPGVTVDRQCGSGLEAVIQACRLIQAGAGSAYLAGGVESISTAPARANRRADGSLEFFDRARFAPAELGDPDMGVGAENVAGAFGISRERQDTFALRSHQLAAASAAGFRAEISGPAADECPRGRMTASVLARFPAAFVPGGTVTAGNSCQDADGAVALLVLSRRRAEALGYAGGLVFRSAAAAGVDPNLPGIGAAEAIRKLGGVRAAGLIEITEAFAAQVLACADLLGVPEQQLNLSGGALALGHPYAASGALQVLRLFGQSAERGPGTESIAAISIAGGLGLATRWCWEALNAGDAGQPSS